jgi:hypothetical protein
MTLLTTDAVDRELASRTEEVAAISATLIELVEERLAGSQKQLDEAGAAGPKEIAELLQVSEKRETTK